MKRHAASELRTRDPDCHQHAHHRQHQVIDRKDPQRAAPQKTLELRSKPAAATLDARALRRQNADDQEPAQRKENPYAKMADLAKETLI